MSEATPPKAPAQAPSRWRRRLLIALGVLVLLTIVFRAVLPFALESAVGMVAERNLGVPASVDNIDLGLLRGQVTIEGLVVGSPDELGNPEAPDPAAAVFRWDRVFAHLDWTGLFDRRVHLYELAIDAPHLAVVRDAAGVIDPLGLADREPEIPEEPQEPSEPWAVGLDRFELNGLDVKLDDEMTGETLEIGLEQLLLGDVGFADQNLTLGSVGLERPVLRLPRKMLFAESPPPRTEEAQKDPEQEAGGPPLDYEISAIDIERAEFTLMTSSQPLDVVIALHAQHVAARPDETFPIKLGIEVGEGSFEYDGTLGLDPVAFEGRVHWENMPIPLFAMVNIPQVVPWLKSCRSAGDLQVSGLLAPASGEEGAGSVRMSGTLAISDLHIADPENGDVVVQTALFEAKVTEAVRVLPAEGQVAPPTQLTFSSIRIVDPNVRYAQPAPALDALIASLGGETPPPEAEDPAEEEPEETAEAAAPAADPSEPPAIDLALGRFELTGGEFVFVDRAVEPPFETSLGGFSVAASDILFPELDAHGVEVKGILPENAPISLTGDFTGGSGKAEFGVEGLALTPFNSFAKPAGYLLKKGRLNLEGGVERKEGHTNIDSDLTLEKLSIDSFDNASFQADFGMPLDVALALLRDPAGNISIPVAASIDESGAVEAGLATIFAGAMRQAMVGALTSPLKMVGFVLPTGGEGEAQLNELPSVAGRPELSEAGDDRLAGLGKLLEQRASLALVVRGRSGPADEPAAGEWILEQQVAQDTELPDVSANLFERRRIKGALEKRVEGEEVELSPEDQALMKRYADAAEVTPERLQELASQRARFVRDALVAGGVAVERVEIGADTSEGAPGVVFEFAVR